ncbi:MAG: C2H2 type zinc finger domain-containing protein, partial [Candidatus Methanomethylicia archaeon]
MAKKYVIPDFIFRCPICDLRFRKSRAVAQHLFMKRDREHIEWLKKNNISYDEKDEAKKRETILKIKGIVESNSL